MMVMTTIRLQFLPKEAVNIENVLVSKTWSRERSDSDVGQRVDMLRVPTKGWCPGVLWRVRGGGVGMQLNSDLGRKP